MDLEQKCLYSTTTLASIRKVRVLYSSTTLASIRKVRVAPIMLQALANIAIGHIGTRAIAAAARIAKGWLLAFRRTRSVPDGEIT